MYPPILFGIEDLRPGQPGRGRFTFSISLQQQFAIQCAERRINYETQRSLNGIGSNIIAGSLEQRNLSPYIFKADRLLVVQCSLGCEGKYISCSPDIEDLRRQDSNLEYVGHNIDTPAEAYTVLSLLTTWAQYAGALL